MTLAWLGHATVLINFYGVRILTDPALYPRIGVDLGLGTLGPMRLVQCALTPDELPEIDLVLVSHAHFDHLDTPSLGAVRGKPSAVMAADISDLLPATALFVGERASLERGRNRHDAARRRARPGDRGQTLGRPHPARHVARLHRVDRRARRPSAADRWRHGCDAGVQGPSRFGPFDAAVMPIGAYDPVDLQPLHAGAGSRRWPMRQAHG